MPLQRIRYITIDDDFEYTFLNSPHEAATSSRAEEKESPLPDPEREWSQFDWS